MRKLFVFSGLLFLVLVVAALLTPATWIAGQMDLARKGASYERMSGTFWNGEAQDVMYRDVMLGDVKWDFLTFNGLSPLGTTWRIDGKGLDYEMGGYVDTLGQQARDMRLIQGHIPAGWVDLSKYAPLLILTGRLEFLLDHASPTGDRSNLATGTIHWINAGLSGLAEESLGTILIELQSSNGFTIADIQSDDDAEIRVNGQVRLNNRQYIVEIIVEADREKQYVIAELAHLGTVNEDGSLEISVSGRAPR